MHHLILMALLAGTWNVNKHGHVYAMGTVQYGVLLALCWNREAAGQPSYLVLLSEQPVLAALQACTLVRILVSAVPS